MPSSPASLLSPLYPRPSLRHLAAAIAAILLISGIAVAAIRGLSPALAPKENTYMQKADTTQTPSQPLRGEELKGGEATPVSFDNIPLEQLLNEVARHYGCDVRFANEQAKGLRLYFTWNPGEPLEQAVKELNLFEQVSIRQEQRTLIVE